MTLPRLVFLTRLSRLPADLEMKTGYLGQSRSQVQGQPSQVKKREKPSENNYDHYYLAFIECLRRGKEEETIGIEAKMSIEEQRRAKREKRRRRKRTS